MKSMVFMLLLALQISFPQFNQVAECTFDDAQILCVADLDGDGTKEIMIWDKGTHELVCYDHSPCLLWTLNVTYPIVTAAAEDINGDGTKEIFVLEDLGRSDIFYQYRIIKIYADGTVDWRKFIEIDVLGELKFHFVNADGKPGKEITIANRIILEEGLERLAFERDRIIVDSLLVENIPYFLVFVPEDSFYELYTFSNDILWQGQPCELQDSDRMEIVCTLFFEAGICSCFEDWTGGSSSPRMKSVRLWSDITGNGKKEAIYYTDTVIQLIDGQNNTLWTWESPSPIEKLHVIDMTGDTCSEIAVVVSSEGMHVPSLYILDYTGAVQSVYALNLSEISTIFFSDLDGDTDIDLLIFDQKRKISILRIYTNTWRKGPLDALESTSSLEVIDPSSAKTRFWIFYAEYHFFMILLLIIFVISGVLLVVRKIMKRDVFERIS